MILVIYAIFLLYIILIYPKFKIIWAPNILNSAAKSIAFIYIAFGLMISIFIPYWLNHDRLFKGLSFKYFLMYSSTTTIVFLLISHLSKKIAVNFSRKSWVLYLIYSVFFILVIVRCFATGIGLNIDSFIQWHHYGAFIGQAELLLNGVIPFNDIPLQYGLGPVLITAAGCKISCWTYLYITTGLMSALETFGLAYIALKTIPSRNPQYIFFILLTILVATLFYPSYQEFLYPITTYPSVSGLRFLPIILMLVLLINHASINFSSKKTEALAFLPAYFFWIICIFWSPEAAVQSGILFFSYLFIRMGQQNSDGITIKLILSFTGLALTMAGFAVSLLSLIFFCITSEWPQLTQYFIYFLYPPVGISHINSRGPIWVIISIFCIWIISSRATLLTNKKSNIHICLILIMCMANFSYYLGHHDDYVLYALIPFFTLLLLTIHYFTSQKFIRVVSLIIISSLLGWSTTFAGWPEFAASIKFRGHPFINFEGNSLVSSSNLFNRSNSNPYYIMHSQHPYGNYLDVKEAIDYLHKNFNESIEIFDPPSLLDSGETMPPWNALHGPVNFWTTPSSYRRGYLKKVAKRINKSGWIIYSSDVDGDEILLDYNDSYSQDKIIEFGKYTAVHFRPK